MATAGSSLEQSQPPTPLNHYAFDFEAYLRTIDPSHQYALTALRHKSFPFIIRASKALPVVPPPGRPLRQLEDAESIIICHTPPDMISAGYGLNPRPTLLVSVRHSWNAHSTFENLLTSPSDGLQLHTVSVCSSHRVHGVAPKAEQIAVSWSTRTVPSPCTNFVFLEGFVV